MYVDQYHPSNCHGVLDGLEKQYCGLKIGHSSYTVKTVIHWDRKELRSGVSTERKDGWYWHGVDLGQAEGEKYGKNEQDASLNFSKVAALMLVHTGSSEERAQNKEKTAVAEEEQNIANLSTSFTDQMDISETHSLFDPEEQQIMQRQKVSCSETSKKRESKQGSDRSPAAASTPVKNLRKQKKAKLDDIFVSPIKPAKPSNGVNAVRASLEPHASLVVRVSQDGRSGLSEKAILGIFWPSKMRVLPH